MEPRLVDEILSGNSDELADLKTNLSILEGFIDLCLQLDASPDINKRFYEESRSLYQATSLNRDITTIESILSKFFGPPIKPAGKALPKKFSKESTVQYLGGIQKEQSLFLLHLKTGAFYGALWPWRHNKNKIEIHMGYCSDWITDTDYHKLETFVKRSLSRSAFERMDTQIGGQIRGIGLPSFLQMAEMEQSSFTIRVTTTGKTGQLHVVDGKLTGAQTSALNGLEAAYHIISWDDTVIEIAPLVQDTGVAIQQPLMHILMESLKIKDEINNTDISDQSPLSKTFSLSKTRRAKPADIPPQKRLVRLERAPGPRMSHRKFSNPSRMVIILGVVVLLGLGSFIAWRFLESRKAQDGYRAMQEQIGAATAPDQKLALLENYLQNHPDTTNTESIKSEIQRLRIEAEDHDFDQTTLKISSLPVNEAYEKTAIVLYGDFLEKYPNSRHAAKINETIGKIKNIVDQYYYEELKQAARLDFKARLEVYRQYLSRFPKGTYEKDVNVLMLEMGRSYLKFLQSQESQCEQTRRWETCIQRYDEFIQNFSDSPLAQDAISMKEDMLARRNLTQMNRLRNEAGTDYQKVYQSLADYLQKNPDNPQRKMIEQEMAQLEQNLKRQRQWFAMRDFAASSSNPIDERIERLDAYLRNNRSGPYASEAQSLLSQLESQDKLSARQRQLEMQKIEEQNRIEQERARRAQQQKKADQLRRQMESELAGSARYRSNGDGTINDLATGSVWCLLDSIQELGGCLTFEGALRYVKGLQTGGYGDWRLPSANELAALYKKEPFFPSSTAQWYWTSEAYSKGYHSVADVVTTRRETVFERENRPQSECGAVRAVRP